MSRPTVPAMPGEVRAGATSIRWSAWSSAAGVQARVVYALVLREASVKFARQRLGYLWAFVEPIAFVAAFTLILSLGGRSLPAGMPTVPFFITGLIPFFLFREVASATLRGVSANKALLVYPQVSAFDVMLARALLEIVTSIVVFVILLAAIWGLGIEFRIERPVEAFGWLVAMGLAGFGFGATCGALEPLFPAVERIVPAVVLRPLFWISGVFFTSGMLPSNLRDMALINPLLHTIELMRSAFFHEFESQYAAPSYALFSLLAALFIAALLHRALRRHILIAMHAQ